MGASRSTASQVAKESKCMVVGYRFLAVGEQTNGATSIGILRVLMLGEKKSREGLEGRTSDASKISTHKHTDRSAF